MENRIFEEKEVFSDPPELVKVTSDEVRINLEYENGEKRHLDTESIRMAIQTTFGDHHGIRIEPEDMKTITLVDGVVTFPEITPPSEIDAFKGMCYDLDPWYTYHYSFITED